MNENLIITREMSNRLARMPLWVGMDDFIVEEIIDEVIKVIKKL